MIEQRHGAADTRQGAVSRVEDALSGIDSRNGADHIFISVDRDKALAAAVAADARHAAGKSLGPMDGTIVAIKDNLSVAGLPWTAGIGAYKGRIAERDAGVVQRLRKAGAIVIGTLNLHEGALGATTDNPHFGRCANPLRDGYTPGGSSGGSAAAVAGGHVDMAVGTDTMGSVRIPAAYCGLAGIKPTDGLIGRDGLAYLSPTLDTIGPLAASVAELRPALTAMQGRDDDTRSLGAPPFWHGAASRGRHPVEGVRIGIPRQIHGVDCEPAVLERFERARETLSGLGAVLEEIVIENWEPGAARRAGLLISEAEGAAAMPDLLDPAQAGVSPEFRSMISYGAEVSSSRLVGALDRIAAARAGCERAMRDRDFLLLPTAPQRAFPHGTAAPPNQADLTALANFAGRPAVNVPVWSGKGELPAGIQLIGHPWREFDLLDVAEAMETALAT